MNKLVSIIIPVYNEEKDIPFCLGSLKGQSYKNIEIIIVDDGSTDNTLNEVKKFKGIRIIKGQHKGPGFSRNLGAKNARGDILIFIDADMTFSKNYIKNLISPIYNDKSIIGTTHDYEVVENTFNIWSRCWGRIRVSKEEAKDVKVFRAIRKSVFLKLRGFDPKYGYADDQTFWFRDKIKPLVAKNTTCYHKNPETLKAVYKQSRWIGASLDNLFIRIPILKFLVPLFLFLVFPIAIPIISIKKVIQFKLPEIIAQMIVFMFARYFGTIEGISRNVYLNNNIR
jgi:glycosyltransferase involved in cell wall biosynthesis